MSDTARVLLTAAALSGLTAGVFAWTLTRLDPAGAERLIGELRLAQGAALILSAIGAVAIGLAVANETTPLGPLEVSLGLGCAVLAGFVLRQEPREGLLLVTGGFLIHALLNIAHRPGLLPPVAPRWYAVGSAIYDVYLAAICYWARRR